MWFEQIGKYAEDATQPKFITTDNLHKLNYVTSGAITHLSYTGKGGFTSNLPNVCKFKAIIPVSNGTNVIVEAGAKTIAIPVFENEVTVHGSYFNS
jgi:hypothetical protein